MILISWAACLASPGVHNERNRRVIYQRAERASLMSARDPLRSFFPWIDYLYPAVREIVDVARCQSGTVRECDRGDLRVELGDRMPRLPSHRREVGESSCRRAVECQNATQEIFGKDGGNGVL